MNITQEQITKIRNSYETNKETLNIVRRCIREHGCTDDGLFEASESFEQGWNNAMEFVFTILGIE